MNKINWGVLTTAKIAREKVIPAMQKSQYAHVLGIASRSIDQAQSVAMNLGIKKVFGSYEYLLNDPEINAVYIPLPNSMHVEWAIKCLQAGKHVLCEKPIGLSSAEARKLADESLNYPNLKVMEAFMYRLHPQWKQAKSLVEEGFIGELKVIQSFFSYYNIDAANIRNKPELGGGALMDVGCYCVSLSRFIFGDEPIKALGITDCDPTMKTDRITSGILQFPKGTSHFTCSTQLMDYQRVNILGTKGRIEIVIPFNAPSNEITKIWLHTTSESKEIMFNIVDQYTTQVDLFSKAILEDTALPVSLEDTVQNMQVIEAIFESAEQSVWKNIPANSYQK
ncbi:MAG: Gfo/Idh/MocA family oxidoreductase [Pyrinomonadaceae bacterium]|nr:Gfo/Idh/MocA family oxidoreductase [Sphingobacteriaceae bacterium]